MYVDKELAFQVMGTPQAETTVDTHVSTNVIDLTHIPRTIIENAYFVFRCAVVPISAGGGTLRIDLDVSAAVGLTTPTTLWSSGTLANATIVAWTANTIIYAVKVPAYMPLQYLGVNYTIATAVLTAGSWEAWLTPNAPYYIPATP